MNLDSLHIAIRSLHAAKDRAYGSAWKKRGEVIGILANLARKVDRLEMTARTGVSTKDETLLDTAVDLLVYCVKHQTYLADESSHVRDVILPKAFMGSASEGATGFDAIWNHLYFPTKTPALPEAVANVTAAFATLEALYLGGAGGVPVEQRWKANVLLTDAASALVARIAADRPNAIGDFITTWTNSEAKA